ncbi:MAG: chemotaxis protein CheA [Fibromonadaceae bacterium]|jgi:two-component system chemotaxis sensor kinase CheA|nr:chemotaxis protein CheA [Fibromonadaceae bacterium]
MNLCLHKNIPLLAGYTTEVFVETDNDILAEYVEESREHLSRMEALFVSIQKTGDVPSGTINDLFRAIHTIKGSAGFLGLTSIGTLTHAMESLLDSLREDRLKMNQPIAEALVEGNDILNGMFDDVDKSNGVDVSGLVEILKKLNSSVDATQEPAPAAPAPVVAEPAPAAPEENKRSVADVLNQFPELAAFATPEQIAEVKPDSRAPAASAATQEPKPKGTTVTQDNNASKASPSEPNKHEEFLRIRVDILDRLMMLAGELVLVRNQQLMHVEQTDATFRSITQSLDSVTTELQETIMRTRMQPIGTVFSRFSRMVRDLSRKLGKNIDFVTEGDEVELDKNILEAIGDPLTHLVRNSCDHGIEKPEDREAAGKKEPGRIILSAYHESGQIHIDIRDNGKGLNRETIRHKVLDKRLKTEDELARMNDQDLINLVFLPGFSTATAITDVSGRGVGMDVVKTGVEKFGGSVSLSSTEGEGSVVKLRLPLTLAIIPSLIVQSGEERFAIPQVNLEELVCLYDKDAFTRIECAGPREVFRLRDTLLPMVRLRECLAREKIFDEDALSEVTEQNSEARKELSEKFRQAEEGGHPMHCSVNFAVLRAGSLRFGLIIDHIHGSEEIVVKPMHRAVKGISLYSGATVLGDGKVAMILDAMGLAKHYSVRDVGGGKDGKKLKSQAEDGTEIRSLLLFSNGGHEQFGVSMQDVKRVEAIETSKIETVGSQEYITLDGVSTRVVRLEDGLSMHGGERIENMFLLIPQNAIKPYGLLVENLVDSGHYEIKLNNESYQAEGVEGTALIKKKMTVLVNLEQLMRLVDGMWYGGNV